MTSKMRSMVVLVVLVLTLGAVSQVMGQGSVTTTRTQEREFTGTVSAQTATTMTVGGRVFNIVQAEIRGTITVGARVKVHYSVASDGTLVARELRGVVQVQGLSSLSDDDLNDDNGQDGAGHDINDDHGQDGAGHDENDDHGGDSGHGDNSGRGGNEDHGGHHGGGDD